LKPQGQARIFFEITAENNIEPVPLNILNHFTFSIRGRQR